MTEPGPRPYEQPYGQPYAQPVERPRQVLLAAVIGFGLSGLCVLVSIAALLSDDEISEQLTGSRSATGAVVFAALLCAAMYVVPAVFVLQRKRWARIMLIIVAVIGFAGGLLSFPGGLLGAAVHVIVLIAMLQQSTRAWFR